MGVYDNVLVKKGEGMTCCVRNRRDNELLLPGEARVRKGFWQGRAVDFFCRGKDKWNRCEAVSMHFLVLTITALASCIITYSNVKIQDISVIDTALVITSGIWLYFLIPGSIAWEVANYGCKNTRKCASFPMITTAALVTACATVLILRENAKSELIRYYENQTWVNETRESIQSNCTEIVLASTEELTSDACVVCYPIADWFQNGIKSPYQSFLNDDVVYVPDCLMPLDGSNLTISVNESRPGRNYLCGIPDTTEDDTTEWLTKQCVLDYIEKELCLYPPLTAFYSNSGRWGYYVEVKGSIHIDMLKRCEEEVSWNVCSLSYSTCDTPEAAEFFAGIQDQYKMVRTNTLHFPENAEEILSKTDGVAAPLTASTTAFAISSTLYEIYAVRTYMLSHDPV